MDMNYFLKRLQAGEDMCDIGNEIAELMNQAQCAYEAEARAKAEESAKAARKKAIATQLCELIGEYGKLECPELESAFKVTEEDIDSFIQSMSDVFALIQSFHHVDLNKLAAPIMKSDDDILRDYIAKILG